MRKSEFGPHVPKWFPHDVVLLTRGRYKCAGWLIINKKHNQWEVCLPGKTSQAYCASLQAAIYMIDSERSKLKTEVRRIEEDNGKSRA